MKMPDLCPNLNRSHSKMVVMVQSYLRKENHKRGPFNDVPNLDFRAFVSPCPISYCTPLPPACHMQIMDENQC